MRLMLYMNPPGVGGMALNPGTVNGIPGYNEDEYANQLIAVFREFGERYGPRVAGYWFDSTFEATECYPRSEEHTSELQSLMRISYAVFCLKKKKRYNKKQSEHTPHRK